MIKQPFRWATACLCIAGALFMTSQPVLAETQIQEIRVVQINGTPTNYLVWTDDGMGLDTVTLLPNQQVKIRVMAATGQLTDPGLQDWGRTGIDVSSTEGPDANHYCVDHTNYPPGHSAAVEVFTVVVPDRACGELVMRVTCFSVASTDCVQPPSVFADVDPPLLPIGPQQPIVQCYPSLTRCLNGADHTTVTITDADLLTGPIDPRCGTGRVVAVQREDAYGNGLFTLGRAADFNCADISLLLPQLSGRPRGAHLVRVIAGDSETPENFGYCYTYVTIQDCTPPAIGECPPDQELAVNGQCNAILPDYRTALTRTTLVPFDSSTNISDNCTPWALLQTKIAGPPQHPGIYQIPAPGTPYQFRDGKGQPYCPNGQFVDVALYVVDQSNNTSSCTFRVSFVDHTPPTIVCPANLELPQFPITFCGREIALVPPSVFDNCCVSSVYPTISNSRSISPVQNQDGTWTATFPIGRSFVTWHVIDCCQNEATCVQEVRIYDIQDPVIECPPNYPVDPQFPIHNDLHQCGASVEVALPVVSDNCDIQLVINDFNWTDDASGFYPVGTTTVNWTVIDEDGRVATCSHTVTVIDTEPPYLGLCQCVQHFGAISPLNFGIAEINLPPCNLIPADQIVAQLLDKWLSDYGWWLLFGARDNCDFTVRTIEFVEMAPNDYYPLVDSNGRYIPRTDPVPLGLSHLMFVAEDPSGNYSDVCLVEILVVVGQCQTPTLPRGACCGFDGSCTELRASECALIGGHYQGDGTTCTPNPCPQPIPQPVGACCLAYLQCEMTTAQVCTAIGGQYKGDGVACNGGAACVTPITNAPGDSPAADNTPAKGNVTPPVVEEEPAEQPTPVNSGFFPFCGWGAAGAMSAIAVGLVGLKTIRRRRK